MAKKVARRRSRAMGLARWADDAAQQIAAMGGSSLLVAYAALMKGYERGVRDGQTKAASRESKRRHRDSAAARQANAAKARQRHKAYAAFYRRLPAKTPPRERLSATAKKFGVHVNTVRNALARVAP